MIGVFIDTFVVLTITALVVISTHVCGQRRSGLRRGRGRQPRRNMAQLCLLPACSAPGVGSGFVAICLLFFAFSTIISWNLFGRINMNYLFGKKLQSGLFRHSGGAVYLPRLAAVQTIWSGS